MLKDRKWPNFPTPPLFEALARGNPLECRDEIWRQKVVGLPDGEEIMTVAFFVLTQYQRVTDGQTDGHVALAKSKGHFCSDGPQKNAIRSAFNIVSAGQRRPHSWGHPHRSVLTPRA